MDKLNDYEFTVSVVHLHSVASNCNVDGNTTGHGKWVSVSLVFTLPQGIG